MGDALTIYATERASHVADPARIGYAIDALARFWGALPIAAIKGETCRRYSRERGVADGTVRRELGVLRAALKHCASEGYLISAPTVVLPDAPPPKDRWLTRSDVARMVWATRRHNRTRHLARFILVAVYTGTRPGAVRALDWNPNTVGGHIDLDRGVLHRAPVGARQTKKRQTPARIPPRLMTHLRRWHRLDEGVGPVVRYDGRAIAQIKSRSWQTLCAAAGIEPCTPHSLRHTAATWLMQNAADKWDAAGFLGMSLETLERVYGHHHPDHQGSAIAAIEGRK